MSVRHLVRAVGHHRDPQGVAVGPPTLIQGKRRSKVVSGMTTKLSWDSPNILPFFSNTPITV